MPGQPMVTGIAVGLAEDQVITGRAVRLALEPRTVTLNWGQWTVHATAGTLRLRAEATDTENLQRIQDMLTTRLENFGRRDQLTAKWQLLVPPPE